MTKTNMKYFIILVSFFINGLLFSQECNTLDPQGRKHGLWKGYHEGSNRLRYQGTFEHGKEVGTFQYFDDTKAGDVIGVRVFDAQNNSVYTTFYDQQKNIVSEGKSINKLKEGIWKYYHYASKKIMTEEFYRAGKLDGARTVYYLNGNIAEITTYKEGIKDGLYKKLTEEGVVLEIVTFKNNEYDGLAVYRDVNNQIVSEGIFTNGKKTGIWKFYENGKYIRSENHNFQGKKFAKKK
ncbi:hypothetical protein B0A77_03045 [Flavobacterium branchiophilum]|uniref:Antitoxin component YwqK of YwqJK toxin-antitoxin module n=2 Tax=Flavobacterium branchiophilum TaxID=55197 RepID=A0A2H3KU11_9FLAO|nr:hypothetical protein B0A77_03045 [Flavobacterium branchiophilum]